MEAYMMKWEFKDGIPIYLQIISHMRNDIASGVMPPGSRIPPVRALAGEIGVNPNTMQRALTQLESEGLLYTQRTNGRFVTEDETVMKKLRSDLSETYIRELFRNLERLGMNRKDIVEAVRRWNEQPEHRPSID